MSALIDKLFTESQANAIKDLWKDDSSRLLLQQEIGKKLIEDERIFEDLPLTQLMFITTLSPFASSTKECYAVAEILYWGLNRVDIMPSIIDHKGKELAYRCLLSLSLFNSAMEKKCNRHGAPSPNFYRQVGIKTFREIDLIDISGHFYNWESFIKEFFAI